jgi:hypothetical protein
MSLPGQPVQEVTSVKINRKYQDMISSFFVGQHPAVKHVGTR